MYMGGAINDACLGSMTTQCPSAALAFAGNIYRGYRDPRAVQRRVSLPDFDLNL